MSDPSFLLVGPPRAGTTLVQHIINSSSEAYLSDECHWLPALFAEKRRFQECFKISCPEVETRWNEAVRVFNRALVQAELKWGLQVTGRFNAKVLQQIVALYPKIKLVNLVRDPRDLLLSYLRVGIESNPRSAVQIAGAAESMRGSCGGVHTLVYEHLASKPLPVLKQLCEFLEISFNHRMLEVLSKPFSHNRTPAIDSTQLAQGKLKLSSENLGHWERYLPAEDLIELNFICPHLKLYQQKVFESERESVIINASSNFSGILLGNGRQTSLSSGVNEFALTSAGAIGVKCLTGKIKAITYSDGREFTESCVWPNTYLLRLAGCALEELPDQVGYTWPMFLRRKLLTKGARIGIYTAGGVTQHFLRKVNLSDYQLVCLVDQAKKGELKGIPIVQPDWLRSNPLDFIIVTSFAYFKEIRAELARVGYDEGVNYCLLTAPGGSVED